MEISNALFRAESVLLKKKNKHKATFTPAQSPQRGGTETQQGSVCLVQDLSNSADLGRLRTAGISLCREGTVGRSSLSLALGICPPNRKHPIFPSPGSRSEVCWALHCLISKPWHGAFPCNSFPPLFSDPVSISCCHSHSLATRTCFCSAWHSKSHR